MRIFLGFVVLQVACVSAWADTNALFPNEKPVEGKRERVVTLVKMPAIAALPLIWGSHDNFVNEMDLQLREGIAKPLVRLQTSSKPGEDFRAEIGGEVGFPYFLANDRQFGQAPMIVTESTSAKFVGSRVFSSDGGGFEFEHDFRPPERWTWQNGPFWGGGEFVFQHRVRFHLKTQTPPIGRSAFMGASDFILPYGSNAEPEVCLLLARFSAALREDLVKERKIDYVQIDAVTFATRDRATIGKFLMRTGSKTDRALFDQLSKDAASGAAEIRSLQSILTTDRGTAKIDSIKHFVAPGGLEPSGGIDWQGKRYVPESFRAVPEIGQMRDVGVKLSARPRLRSDGETCSLSLQIERDLEPLLETRIKTNPALLSKDDPAAVGAVEQYTSSIGCGVSLRLGETQLVAVLKPDQFVTQKDRAGEWQFTFVRASQPFPKSK